MPTLTAVFWERKRNPVFSARWEEAVLSGRKRTRLAAHEVERVLERVARGEGLVAVCAEPDMPSAAAVHAHRRRHPQDEHRWTAALGTRRGVKVEKHPTRIATYLDAAKAGQETRALDKLIHWRVVHRIRATDQDFAARLAEAKRSGVQRVARQASARQLSPSELHAVVEAAVRHVPPHARDDVRGDLYLALYSGEVAPEDAKAATRQLVTAWNRQFGRRDLSFDQEIGEGGLTFGGMIADPGSYVPGGVEVIRAAW